MVKLASDGKLMSDILNERKSKGTFWIFFLIVLAFSAAVSLAMRVFSFYTLPHYQKVLVLGFLGIIIVLFLFRYVFTFHSALAVDRRKIAFSAIIALAATAILLGVLPYHQAPIRTRHTLSITNLDSQFDLVLTEIKLPGDQIVDLPGEYPDDEVDDGSLLLAPNQALTYSREMVGGLALSFSTRAGHPLEVEVNWDGRVQQLSLPVQEDLITVKLPGWTWGEPSLIYQSLGWVNILADGISLLGVLFFGVLWFFERKTESLSMEHTGLFYQWLEPYTIPIWINIGCIALAGLLQIVFPQSMTLSLLLFLSGVATFILFILKQYPRLILWMALMVIAIGIAYNINVFFNPTNELHLSISILQDDSFAVLAQKAGDSTYLSMGYYRYFRGAILHIPEPLMVELNLYSSRLEEINIGLRVVNDQYDYDLSSDATSQLLNNYDWQIWPKEGGGEFYLYPGEGDSADEYYFYKFGNQYFLLTPDFISETGVINVPVLD